MIFNAENFHIFRLGAVPVSYPPKYINTVALLVTPENIGALSLELEGELRYNVEAEPYFKTWVSRKSAEVEGGSVCLTVYEGDWLVILWNEIRIFRQEEFEKTFQVDHGPDAVNVASDIWVKPEGSTETFAKVGVVEDKHAVRGELPENPHNTQGVDTP